VRAKPELLAKIFRRQTAARIESHRQIAKQKADAQTNVRFSCPIGIVGVTPLRTL